MKRHLIANWEYYLAFVAMFAVISVFIVAGEVSSQPKRRVKACEDISHIGCKCDESGVCQCDGERWFCAACEPKEEIYSGIGKR